MPRTLRMEYPGANDHQAGLVEGTSTIHLHANGTTGRLRRRWPFPAWLVLLLTILSFMPCNLHSGALDPAFDAGAGFDDFVNVIEAGQDGRLLVGGLFSSAGGQTRNRIARLKADGSLDAGFDPSVGPLSGFVWAGKDQATITYIAALPDRRILAAGFFTSFNRTPRTGIVRLNEDGSVDETFDAGLQGGFQVSTALVLPDGRIVVAGDFKRVAGVQRNGLALLGPDGALDFSFDPGANISLPGSASLPSIRCMASLPGDRFLIAGLFSVYNGTNLNCLAALHLDGMLDTSFATLQEDMVDISALAVQPDGQILIAAAEARMVRLDTNGIPDNTFKPVTWSGYSQINALAVQTSGKILVGGGSRASGEMMRRGLLRFLPSGVWDTNYPSGSGPNQPVYAIHVLPDDRVVAGGSFTSFDELPHTCIAQLLPENPPIQPPLIGVIPARDGYQLYWPTARDGTYRLQYSSDLASRNWTQLGQWAGDGFNGYYRDPQTNQPQRFYRIEVEPR